MYSAEKYKFWDNEMNTWYKPVYPRTVPGKNNKLITFTNTHEILLSQAGDLFIHEHTPEKGSIVTLQYSKDQNPRYIPCLYTRFKDCQGKKIYVNDALRSQGGQISVVELKNGCLICRVRDPECDHPIEYLCDAIKANAVYFGNILETPEILSE